MQLDGDLFWTRRSPQSTGSRLEESRAAHEGGGRTHPPGARPLPRGQPGNPPDVKSTPTPLIYTQNSRKKPRSGVPLPQASVATRNQSRPSPAPCRRGPSSPVAMEEYPGEATIVMEAKDQRENLSPSRGRPWRRKHKGENLSSSLWVAPECHREGNHRRGDHLHHPGALHDKEGVVLPRS